MELSTEFGLDLNLVDDDFVQLVDDQERYSASPVSPTLSVPSSTSTASDSSLCASPVAPCVNFYQPTGMDADKDALDLEDQALDSQISMSNEQ